MVRLEDYNMTFFHAPKNAGTSISEWLVENANGDEYDDDLKHNIPSELIRVFPDGFGWSFFCARNPWDRNVSWYKFFKKQGKLTVSFEEYMNKAFNPNTSTSKYTRPIGKQISFVKEVDYILKYENLVQDFKVIQNKIGCDKPLGWHNKSYEAKYVDFYTKQEHIDIVKYHYSEDIEALGYKFGE